MMRWLSFIFLLSPFFISAQQSSQYIFRHIDQQDGLLHNMVSSMVQDKHGFMWIATANGIQRFDGFRFVDYEDKLKKFSYSPIVRNIYADNKNNIWIAGSQLACINAITGRGVVYSEKEMLNDRRFKYETYTDRYHRKWLLGDFALYCEDSVSGKMKLFSTYTPGQTSQLGNIVYPDTLRHCIWVTDHNNFMLFDQTTKTVCTADYNILNNPVLKAFAKKSVSFIFIDKQNNIWAAEWNSVINKYDTHLKTVKKYFQLNTDEKKPVATNKDTTITTLCIYQDKHGSIWIGNDHPGLFRYNQSTDHFETISGKNSERRGLEYNYVFQSISEDRDGNLWLGTDKGISIFNPYRQYFYTIAHQENNSASLPKHEITSFLQAHNGALYIGTWGGGFSVYDSAYTFQKTILPKGVFELPLIWCFAEDNDGKIWVGAQHGYLHIYDPLTGHLKTIHPAEMENKTIRCMKKDSEGNLWFGLHSGKIVKWENRSGKFYSQPKTGFENQWPVRNIFIDRRKQFWVCTDNGLLQFDSASLQYLDHYLPSAKVSYIKDNNEMHGIEQQNDSILIIGTMRNGLYQFNTHTKQFIRHPAFSNFPANIYALKEDAAHNLWMSSDYCLYELRHKDGKLVKHNLPSGLINSAFEMLNFYQLQNGSWVTSSKTEAVVFNPAVINSGNSLNKKVTLTGFKVFDKEISIDSLVYNNKALRLNYDQNFITLEFTTHSYSGITESIYYKLSGIDKNWVKANEKAIASYTNLAPGKYLFRVKAGNENSESTVTSYSIIITPPFYATWSFRILVFLVVVSLIYYLVRKRIENIRHKAELRHKVSETEMMALRSQMNPHFIFNCLSAIDNLIQTNQPDKATTYLARFAKLIRSVLESTKNNLVPFYKDFESLQLYVELEQFRSGNKFFYQLIADDELLNGDYKVPPLIVQPFAENAIHHGLLNKMEGKRTLFIKARLQDNFICYTITDNGIGRKKAMEIKDRNKPGQTSYGLEITEERIHLHNQKYLAKNDSAHYEKLNHIDFNDLMEDGWPTGTEVNVHIICDH
jgi:ligand-binding sensor domain-containing protein/anti-sigma regulatory factor (Ser/Thr protein kinase)